MTKSFYRENHLTFHASAQVFRFVIVVEKPDRVRIGGVLIEVVEISDGGKIDRRLPISSDLTKNLTRLTMNVRIRTVTLFEQP
jgi:hypothetical protein